ncbi:dipeptidase [Pseudarthrobacter sp. J75]|uniref:dipeptidase n=1 Tax=unclassified Pseudarthrobacter TaxID=2647000 RepID=UPI002E803E3B|nr:MULTISPECIES: dipeptidase [unclassified Pseudarthrobacter]MEE2523805.1 dipeptidase [Pseudarthrobacter sp. J47]MEE2529971.1 dipeptidase [Pseudarthrobacter sp. J75]
MSTGHHLIIDGHNDMLSKHHKLAGLDFGLLDPGQEQLQMHTDLVRLRRGGVGAQFWSIWVPSVTSPDDKVAMAALTLAQIEAVHRMCETYPHLTALARSADDVERCFAEGRIASLMGVEGGHQILDSIDVLRLMHRNGVKYMTLTHNTNTGWADSATDGPGVGGLNAFGEQVVATMNDLGMLVDLSHCADTTVEHVTRLSTAPLFFSHSGARAVSDHPRNVPDATLKNVRASGGIVMAVFLPEFLSVEYRAWSRARQSAQPGWIGPDAAAQEAAWLVDNPKPPCGIPDIADHIEHIRNVAGVEHVGIGSDFDGMTPPDDMASVDRYPALLAELERRGWSSSDIAALTHGNLLRVLRITEERAGKFGTTPA